MRVLHGDFVEAAWSVLLAGLFDLFDGQLARLTKGSSQFGIEYDSLTDLASFGFAPAILIYMWALNDFKRLGWIISFVFFACGALRLARFNVQAEEEEKSLFQGLPIPMAAYSLVTTVIFYESQYRSHPHKNFWILGSTLLLSLLMVSTVRYRSLKEVHLTRRLSFFMLVAGAVSIALIALKPNIMMWIVCWAYVAFGLLEELFWLLRGGRKEENAVEKTDKKNSLAVINSDRWIEKK